jgi:CheY-like chemotaxis protein
MPDREDPAVLPLDPAPLVLVVDDQLTTRTIIARMIRTLGYSVRTCPSGWAAMRFLQEHRGSVRLLLADLAMPRMDGGELAERARDLQPSIQVVLMAAPGDPHVDLLRSGYFDVPWLTKPVAFGELAELLEDRLGPPVPPTPEPRSIRRPTRRQSGRHST